MAAEHIYYIDYLTPGGGTPEQGGRWHRNRVMMMAPYGGFRSFASTPEWGETAAPETNWRQLPEGCWMKGSSGEHKYDELAIGAADPPTRTFPFRLDRCVGDTDLEFFAHALLNPILPAGRLLIYPGGSPTEGSVLVDQLNAFILLTDEGDASRSISTFRYEYVGVQERKVEEEFDIDQMVYEASTIHILNAALQNLKPVNLREYMYRGEEGGDFTPKVCDMVYMLLYLYDTVVHFRALGTFPGVSPRQNFHWFPIQDLWTSIGSLMEKIIDIYLATSSGNITWSQPTGYPSGVGSLTTLDLYGQDTSDNTGAHTTDADVTDAYFLGYVTFDTAPTEKVGGWLHEDEESAGVFQYDSLWDLFKDITEAYGARLMITQNDLNNFTLTFCGADYRDTLNDITAEHFKTKPKPVLRKGLIAGAECDINGSESGDIQNVSISIWGTDEDPKRSIPSVFHSNHAVGARDDVITIASDESFNSDFGASQNVAGVVSQDVPVSLLAYFHTPSFAVRELCLAFHHYVGIRRSISTDIVYNCIDEPTLTNTDDGHWPIFGPTQLFLYKIYSPLRRKAVYDFLWDKQRLAMLQLQKQAGIPFAVCSVIADVFSHWNQFTITTTVASHLSMIDHLGTCSEINLPLLLPIGDFLDIVNGDPILTSVKVTKDTGLAEITLIASGD